MIMLCDATPYKFRGDNALVVCAAGLRRILSAGDQSTTDSLRHAFHCEAIVSSVEPLIRALRN
jgi:hypothetical protein